MTDARSPAPPLRIVVALGATYALYGVLMNSVGTVILQSIASFAVSKTAGSILEGCKDLTCAAVSFLLASSLPRFGYRRALVWGLLLLGAGCAAMPVARSFGMTALSFVITGATFGLSKVVVYGTIGLIAPEPHRHASLTGLIEGVFMVGVLGGYWLFGAFINPDARFAWLRVYWLLAGCCAALAALWAVSPLDETPLRQREGGSMGAEFVAMLTLVRQPVVRAFLLCAFLYVLIEQGLGTWMPTFNHEVLRLSPVLSVEVASVYAGSLCVGRISAGLLLRRVSRFGFVISCTVAMAPLVLIALAATAQAGLGPMVERWQAIAPSALILPLIGLLLAPIYPTINSVVLSALPVERQAAMTGLIVVFSAIGGTLGSFLTARLFAVFGGRVAVAGVLVPVALLLASLGLLRRLSHAARPASGEPAPEPA
ncbi:sugar MFS transporter [uncultured Sphingomonas sp.]|uniref:MFS transporter n=1 Tax=uncultured Sphingomonas sp. TaxID=158754 RepID=UPI0035CBE00A